MKLIKEAKRFQELAGINEVKIQSKDNRKALGTVFYENPDTEEAEEYDTPYVWNDNFVEQLAKDLGFEDYEDVAGEFVRYTEPGSEEDIRALENILGLKD
jgi:hypothetical protein